jgi:hypothetical protein
LRASAANGRFDEVALSQLWHAARMRARTHVCGCVCAALTRAHVHAARCSDIRVEPGRVRCSLPVSRAVQNRYGTLHGGCIGAHTRRQRCQPQRARL